LKIKSNPQILTAEALGKRRLTEIRRILKNSKSLNHKSRKLKAESGKQKVESNSQMFTTEALGKRRLSQIN
jgi:hypothetical protein